MQERCLNGSWFVTTLASHENRYMFSKRVYTKICEKNLRRVLKNSWKKSLVGMTACPYMVMNIRVQNLLLQKKREIKTSGVDIVKTHIPPLECVLSSYVV
jgi:hypothetical protein